jgi:divalent metal cation (Fe/Co/Zn/Cd) transporter
VAGVALLIPLAVVNSSAALIGFGIDSAIEIFASLVVVWELTGVPKERERRALGLISAAFFGSAVYIGFESVRRLLTRAQPTPSASGIVWVALTVVVMLLLARGKDRVGKNIDNAVLRSEARVTLIDAYVAATVLIGLVLNAAFGWWWADPIAALGVVVYALQGGLEARRESAG